MPSAIDQLLAPLAPYLAACRRKLENAANGGCCRVMIGEWLGMSKHPFAATCAWKIAFEATPNCTIFPEQLPPTGHLCTLPSHHSSTGSKPATTSPEGYCRVALKSRSSRLDGQWWEWGCSYLSSCIGIYIYLYLPACLSSYFRIYISICVIYIKIYIFTFCMQWIA